MIIGEISIFSEKRIFQENETPEGTNFVKMTNMITFCILRINQKYIINMYDKTFQQIFRINLSEEAISEKVQTGEKSSGFFVMKNKEKIIELILEKNKKQKKNTFGFNMLANIVKISIKNNDNIIYEDQTPDEVNKSLINKYFKMINFLEEIEQDEKEIKKLLVKNTENDITKELPIELVEIIIKNI